MEDIKLPFSTGRMEDIGDEEVKCPQFPLEHNLGQLLLRLALIDHCLSFQMSTATASQSEGSTIAMMDVDSMTSQVRFCSCTCTCYTDDPLPYSISFV